MIKRPKQKLEPAKESLALELLELQAQKAIAPRDDLLTVVITNWKRPKLLKRCLDSVFRNRVSRVVVSSSELSEEVAEVLRKAQVKHPHLQFTALRTDHGCNENWLRGVYLASTPYVLLLHDDDCLSPQFHQAYEEIIRPQLEAGIGAVLWNGQVVEDDKVLEEIHKQHPGPTGIYPTAERLSALLSRRGYAVSPVVQIFKRDLAIRTLKECEQNFKRAVFFTKPKMLLGNEVLLGLRHMEACSEFLYVDQPLTYYGRWDGSESEIHLKAKSRELLDGYDAAREYFELHPAPNFRPEPRIIHITSRYPVRDADTHRRHRLAWTTWQRLYESGKWLACPVFDNYLKRNGTLHGDPHGVPFIRDLIETGIAMAQPEDILVLTNSDIAIATNATARILDHFDRHPTGFSFRKDFYYPLYEPIEDQEIARARWYVGADLFAFRKEWWKTFGGQFPDLVMGRPGWDWVLRSLMGITRVGRIAIDGDVWDHSQFLDIPNLIYHEKHRSWFERPENKESEINLYNLRLTWAFFNRYRPYETWTKLMRDQFPKTSDFRKRTDVRSVSKKVYHTALQSYRRNLRPRVRDLGGTKIPRLTQKLGNQIARFPLFQEKPN